MTREKLTNGNKWCHIYTDTDGVVNYHDTERNETYRVIPDKSALGFHLEYHKDGELKARNSISFAEMKSIASLAGSNHLLNQLVGGEKLNNVKKEQTKEVDDKIKSIADDITNSTSKVGDTNETYDKRKKQAEEMLFNLCEMYKMANS
jgi:hypothetical protein